MSNDMFVGYSLNKRIIKSSKVGAATPSDIRELTTKLVSMSSQFKTTGWGYVVDISKMDPVTPDVSVELVEMTKKILANGCKAMAFVEGGAFMTAAQAKQHQKQSNSTIKEGHFRTEAEAMKWLESVI